MNAVKGAWFGRAFAVASCNDSGGRKTRIRRSKEERKSMVETFIKTYQKSNHGNFPSLNLTHKEVGGSFYKVREIVREIIQENRILGPAKLLSEEQNDEHPLLSLSIEPHSSLSSTDAIPVIPDAAPSHCRSPSIENVLDSNGQIHGFDKNQSDNEQMVGVRSDILERDRHEEPHIHSCNEIIEDEIEKDDNTTNDSLRNLLLHHQVDADDSKISCSSGNITEAGNESLCSEQIVDDSSLTVEKVEAPQEPVYIESGNITEDGNESLCSEKIVNGSCLTVEKVEAPQEPIYIESPVNESLGDNEDGTEEPKVSNAGVTRKIADVVVEKFPLRPISTTFVDWDENSSEINGPTLEMKSEVMNKQVLETSLQTSTSSSNEAATAADFKVKDSSVETKTWSGSSNRAYEKSVSEYDSSHQKGNNPPLDRINLETWKETTNKHETNPLLAFFKALITPIMKLLD